MELLKIHIALTRLSISRIELSTKMKNHTPYPWLSPTLKDALHCPQKKEPTGVWFLGNKDAMYSYPTARNPPPPSVTHSIQIATSTLQLPGFIQHNLNVAPVRIVEIIEKSIIIFYQFNQAKQVCSIGPCLVSSPFFYVFHVCFFSAPVTVCGNR